MKPIYLLLLLLAGSTFDAFAQQSIQGKVIDDKGAPLEGVTVTIKGAKNTVTTNSQGSFEIRTNSSGRTILTFSYSGFKTAEVSTNGSAPVSVRMEMKENRLDDVIVIGYGTRHQKDLAGSVSSISSKDFNPGRVLSPQQSIQGKVPGVNISQNSGKPGGSNTIRIRGGTSLTGSNDPLYVIDGVPISNTAGVGQANIPGNGTDVFDQSLPIL